MIQIVGMAALAAFLAGSSLSWYLTSSYKQTQCDAKIEAASALIAKASQKATETALQQERAAVLQLNTLEVEHATVRQSLDQLARENRRLATELGGLRDPGRSRRDGAVQGTAAVSGEPVGPADAGAKLSDEATAFLLGFAEDADRAASYAAACRDWATVVTGTGPLETSEAP